VCTDGCGCVTCENSGEEGTDTDLDEENDDFGSDVDSSGDEINCED